MAIKLSLGTSDEDLEEITLEELYDGEDIAPCPSCSLKIRVLFEEAPF